MHSRSMVAAVLAAAALTAGPAALQAQRRVSWSPDGRRIVVSVEKPSGLLVTRADGTAPHKLYSSGKQDLYPSWSPNGRLIAFSSKADGDAEIYVVGADGSGLRKLTKNDAGDTYP